MKDFVHLVPTFQKVYEGLIKVGLFWCLWMLSVRSKAGYNVQVFALSVLKCHQLNGEFSRICLAFVPNLRKLRMKLLSMKLIVSGIIQRHLPHSNYAFSWLPLQKLSDFINGAMSEELGAGAHLLKTFKRVHEGS